MSGIALIIVFILAIIVMIVAISKFKVHPFLAIMAVSLILAIIAGIYMGICQNAGFVSFLAKLGLQLLEFSEMFNLILIIYLILGVGIGVLGSSLSMRKYLKV